MGWNCRGRVEGWNVPGSCSGVFMYIVLIGLCSSIAACGLPERLTMISYRHGEVTPLEGFEEVRAVDGYPSDAFQASFDEALSAFMKSPVPPDGRRDWDSLVLSSGGINGAFGTGILTGWTERGDRPDYRFVTGVSVGALMAPFAFAGPEFDDRLVDLFRHVEPEHLHRKKDFISSVLWDESLMDNSPLRALIDRAVDEELMRAVAARHAEGRRCYVGSTNLDVGHFVVWDLGAIASRGTKEALQLFRQVLAASASVPILYPPIRFSNGDHEELHVDGAVIRPLFIPHNVFDSYLSAERAGMNWEDVDDTMYVIHNGSLYPHPLVVQRDTITVATRTVTMMSYTMVAEDVLHLYLLSRAWDAQFRFVTLPDGSDLDINSFTPEDTERLFAIGQRHMKQRTPWATAPPGFILAEDFIHAEGVSEMEPPTHLNKRLRLIEKEFRNLLPEGWRK